MSSTEITTLRESSAAKRRRSVRERLLEPNRNFSNSEMKAVRVLLANYPAAGLTTVSKLAKQAGVSDPTVLRLAQRLDFEGFAEMQEALLAEVEAHMRSPLTLPAASPSRRKPNAYQSFLADTLSQCEAVARETATADYERAVALLTDPRMRVLCLGGRFSRFLAGILQRCLHHMREGTVLLDGTGADLVDELASLDKRHVLAVFDYRRYQTDVVRFAALAKARGTHVILFTDQWMSPIAEFAEVIITAPTATSSPFDTLVTPLLQVEAVAVGVAERLGPDWRSRAAMLEEVRNDHHVTLGASPASEPHKRRMRKKGS
ncbi:MurR/RpiR family transcriptional regulator [Aestuariivirga sp.]|uniref:MurR/RpiR family transcriptional regulator n=1 Tax=Aestuariivirga sp. TaxID=2650926 RepID=UPI003BA9DD25